MAEGEARKGEGGVGLGMLGILYMRSCYVSRLLSYKPNDLA